MNANGTNRNDEPARRRWLSADRLLLGAILALQVLILCRLRPADGARGSSVADDSSVKPAAKNETLRRGDASELSVARAQSPKPGDPAGQVANPAVVLLPPAFPAAAQPLRSWPDEAALSLLEAARLEHCMDGMLAQAMSEFERMSPFINLAEAWPALAPSPTMDMREDSDCYAVLFSLPGLDASDITVTLEGRLLTVTARSKRQARAGHQQYSFERRVWLPGPVKDETQARAALTNGVLRVTIPKTEADGGGAAGRRIL